MMRYLQLVLECLYLTVVLHVRHAQNRILSWRIARNNRKTARLNVDIERQRKWINTLS